MSRVRPPTARDADEVIGDAHGTRERLLRVARALFSFYERGGPHIEVDIRERQLPGMREWEESQRATVAALVGAALAGEAPKEASLRLISAFFDLPTYKALRTRGVSTKRAAETVAEVALGLLPQYSAARLGGES
jgi:hypothetical protein